MKQYHELKTIGLEDYTRLSEGSGHSKTSLDSPAQEVMTDFRRVPPLTMSLTESVSDATRAMRKVHVRSVIVTDSSGDFRGILTVMDLESRKVLSQATSLGLKRDDLSIKDVMISREKLRGVTLSALQQGTIGDLLKTLRHEGSMHMLVVDPESHAICGIISASEIARRLQIPVEINLQASSFRDLVDALFGRGETV
ncbi:CBS domain-containing protein [Marinobacterium sediminicola]|uniref:CBS domain-containing protein n=1 Tax=Marinobacterium sediminicola TaxID=518898 RepID=A0ABY1S191_9GAMM|nr:CBS domain-containing protein [Marinobacterium sediminicola]ULG69771.1 CBS domain-containing protein [Marinobacterium sediminicola]SMR75418.1 CBS domain-containing protein [Marinobacterium sediminicola]